MTRSEAPSFLTVAEVSRLLQVRPERVTLWCRDGQLLAVRVGRHWQIDRAALEYVLALGGAESAPKPNRP